MAHITQQTGGRFITFEGGEGAGKSTQIKHLATRLQAAGISPVLTREPGGSPFAERARDILLDPNTGPKSPLAQSLLFFAARTDHLDETIRPALAAGRWVICDRFTDSTHAYQGAASGVAPATIATLDQLVVGQDQPHLTILLDLDPKVGLARADQRRTSAPGTFVAADTYEGRQLDFHKRLREGFLNIARHEPNRVIVIDAFRNELTIADEIWNHISTRFAIAPASQPTGI
jgi:dTMP kinase